jgi:hypothetical protein
LYQTKPGKLKNRTWLYVFFLLWPWLASAQQGDSSAYKKGTVYYGATGHFGLGAGTIDPDIVNNQHFGGYADIGAIVIRNYAVLEIEVTGYQQIEFFNTHQNHLDTYSISAGKLFMTSAKDNFIVTAGFSAVKYYYQGDYSNTGDYVFSNNFHDVTTVGIPIAVTYNFLKYPYAGTSISIGANFNNQRITGFLSIGLMFGKFRETLSGGRDKYHFF